MYLQYYALFFTVVTSNFPASLLLLRRKRAKKIAQVAEELLSRLLPEASADDDSIILKWISEKERSCVCSSSVFSECYRVFVIFFIVYLSI